MIREYSLKYMVVEILLKGKEEAAPITRDGEG